jgi:selenocysteine lyase/cysteine desulfurase
MTRADFLANTFNITLMSQLDRLTEFQNDFVPPTNSLDERYWSNFRQQFYLDNNLINFRANAASPIPKKVLDFFIKEYRDIQSLPSVKNKGIEEGEKEALRVALSKEINCSVKELAIMRNTTEALNNVIMGFPFKKGDEVIASVHEYDSMLGSLYQRQIKDGITIKTINIPYQPQSKEQIVEIFEKNITNKTSMFLISHIIWISGQIYPIKEICELARKNNITTVIDAAQSFSHINVDVADIGCDYLGTSLHKWCSAPLGTGFLYVRKDLISKTYPLIGSYKYFPDDEAIEKFENFGTVTPVFNAANASIQFWQKLGLNIKTHRMQSLKEYWTQQLQELPNIEILTNNDNQNSCGVAFFHVRGKSAVYVANQLWEKHKITVQAIENYKNNFVDYKDVNAIGIATPVFITKANIDKLVSAIRSIQ